MIGVFTIFLVVSFITLLNSAVAISPIIFVGLGQEESSAIDFKLITAPGKKQIHQGV